MHPSIRQLQRRFVADQHGLTGAERTLVVCFGLALVMLIGTLLQGGGEKAAQDAQRALTTRQGGTQMGAVVHPLRAAGPVSSGGEIVSAGPLSEADKPSASPTPAPEAPKLKSGLGDAVDILGSKSPILIGHISALQKDGWVIKYGAAGGGSYTDKTQKLIVIDGGQKSDPKFSLQTLAHEVGHARYTADPYVQPTGLTREQYIDRNVMNNLKDEGEATITNIEIRNEIIKNGGADIGVAGAGAKDYIDIYTKAKEPRDRAKLREEIGRAFAKGERPSTDPSKTYYDYYAKPYADFWDKNVKPLLGGGR